MAPESEDIPEDALRDIAYLTRSKNRVRILRSLAEAPSTPREVADETGTSRSTLQRILSELEGRGWARRTPDGRYATTPTGRYIVKELTSFAESIETIRELGDAVDSLPTDVMPIGTQNFGDATIRRPEPNDPMAPGLFLTRLIQESAELHCLAHLAAPLELEKIMRDRVVDGALRGEYVLTAGLVNYLCTSPDRMARWRELIEEGADVYRCDNDIPCNLFVTDATVVLGKTPSKGDSCVFLESADEVVLDWAHDVIETHRAEADRLTVEAFSTERVPSTERV